MTALDGLSDAVIVVGEQSGVFFVNHEFADRFGVASDHLNAPSSAEAVAMKAVLDKVFASTGKSWQGNLPAPANQMIPVVLHLYPIHDSKGKLTHRMAVTRVSSLNDAGHANKDPLTGLPVRAFLIDRIEHTAQAIKRHGGFMVLMVLGLDRFTLVNDAHGFAAGDTLLTMAADRIRTCIRESDSAFRLDGDKFGILLTVTVLDDVILVAEKVLTAMREPYCINDQEVLITSSIGIGTYPNDTEDVGHLVVITENSLHHAKQAGRNQYQFFSTDMNGKALNRFTLASRIRKAISNDEFVVYYQPKVRSDDQSILGAEALARWKDPEFGLVLPDDFIPVAEETGLIEEIGKRILEVCCRQGRKWMDAGYDHLTLSCNLSHRQFRNSHLVENIADILTATGLPATWLELEITEAMIVADLEGAARKMVALRELGVKLSISDFGTGHASLAYLSSFPMTSLKLDKAFVTDVDSNPKTAEMARSIIGLSKGLNVDLVAEGCEVPAHLKFLQDHGCNAVQGFYFSKPVPANEFEAMLRAGMVYPVPSIEMF